MPTGDDIIANVALGGAPGRGTSDYTLAVEQASELFALGGVPRSIRSVQRFCRKGHLDAITLDTDRGKYLMWLHPSSKHGARKQRDFSRRETRVRNAAQIRMAE
jgi:hypothetical protein